MRKKEINRRAQRWPIWLLLLLSISSCASQRSPSEIYPNRLITSDFGIVTVDDLAYDATTRLATPYDPNKNLLASYWQCVPTNAVTPKYNNGVSEDPMGPAGIEIPMCDLEILIRTSKGIHIYSDRRRHPDSFCHEFEKNWRELTRGEKIVCLSGNDPSNESDPTLGKYRAWVWDKFKTQKGCYSYFGDCNVTGCAKGKCANESKVREPEATGQ